MNEWTVKKYVETGFLFSSHGFRNDTDRLENDLTAQDNSSRQLIKHNSTKSGVSLGLDDNQGWRAARRDCDGHGCSTCRTLGNAQGAC